MTTSRQSASSTRWADRASALYDEAYARRYRAHDEEFEQSGPCRDFASWLEQVCRSLPAPIDVLDLGCGTGRYFWALSGVRNLVGIDASAAMLAEAQAPYNASRITAASVTLIHDDIFSHRFEPQRARPAGNLTVFLRWRAQAPMDRSYKIFVHVLDASLQNVVAQRDAEPLDGRAPTTSWVPGEVLEDEFAIGLPSSLGPGNYAVEVGVYEERSGERLLLPGGESRLVLDSRLEVR